jgi:hypothetical protein
LRIYYAFALFAVAVIIALEELSFEFIRHQFEFLTVREHFLHATQNFEEFFPPQSHTMDICPQEKSAILSYISTA